VVAQAIGAVCDQCGEVRTYGVQEPLGRHWKDAPELEFEVMGRRYRGVETPCGQWIRFSAVLPPVVEREEMMSDPMAPKRHKRRV
jgi:hypothetical protein